MLSYTYTYIQVHALERGEGGSSDLLRMTYVCTYMYLDLVARLTRHI